MAGVVLIANGYLARNKKAGTLSLID